MTKQILLLLILTQLISCHNCDFEIDKNLIEDFNSYEKGQIIYFESNQADLDTIEISGTASYEVCHSLTVQDYKISDIRIEHLPKNKWKSSSPKWANDKRKITDNNQSILNVDMRFESDGPKYTKWIEFRDFAGEIKVKNSIEEIIDTILMDSKQAEITQVYWSNKNGLVGYKKFDGQVYRIKNVP
ncbi:hypothetical protein DKG77_10745 [Flagellimonas aquimarina]|uniref:Uncharacterized protein n=1 Tax=Flagellimonas aquimarina TaxID=2201895 RepID=A0A316KWX0_9FLAO|nr:hypothetical protein [Allomuricauda koreensis]PWL38717.1 hypothetical protein DKG77_10745 [Allomuricauda koreensis]